MAIQVIRAPRPTIFMVCGRNTIVDESGQRHSAEDVEKLIGHCQKYLKRVRKKKR